MSDKFTFDGQMMSKREIGRALGMSESTIRKHFKAGRYTRQAIIAYEPDAAKRAGGRRGTAKVKRTHTTRLGKT